MTLEGQRLLGDMPCSLLPGTWAMLLYGVTRVRWLAPMRPPLTPPLPLRARWLGTPAGEPGCAPRTETRSCRRSALLQRQKWRDPQGSELVIVAFLVELRRDVQTAHEGHVQEVPGARAVVLAPQRVSLPALAVAALLDGAAGGGSGSGAAPGQVCGDGRARACVCVGTLGSPRPWGGWGSWRGDPSPAMALATTARVQGLLRCPVEARRESGQWAFSPAFRFAQPPGGRNLVLVFHFLVAFVHSEITETHFIANGIPFQEKKKKKRTGFFFLRDKTTLY